jgi:hypothetical protein
MGRAAAVLAAPPWGDRPRRVLADSNAGELLFRTPHAVLTTWFHRDWPRIRATLDAFAGPGDGPARALVARHGIELVLVCPRRGEGEATFHGRLGLGLAPPWLEPVAGDLGGYALFRVRDGG